MFTERRNNELILPSIYGSSRVERRELELVEEVLPKYLQLKTAGNVNTGVITAILSSNTNGYGRFSQSERHEHNLAAYNLKSELDRAIVVEDATSSDLKSVIQNPDYANVIVIGHASYHSWVASNKSVDWYDLAQMTDNHLKNGVFINGGCGQITSWNYIPLGLFTVNNSRNLYGKKAEYMWSDELQKPNPFRSLTQLNPNLSFIPKQ